MAKLSTAEVGECIADHIEEIKHLFIPSMMITVIARNPAMPHGYMVITRDNIDEVISTLQSAKTPHREEIV